LDVTGGFWERRGCMLEGLIPLLEILLAIETDTCQKDKR